MLTSNSNYLQVKKEKNTTFIEIYCHSINSNPVASIETKRIAGDCLANFTGDVTLDRRLLRPCLKTKPPELTGKQVNLTQSRGEKHVELRTEQGSPVC
ncbi:MAG: hypothetical protein AAFY24_08140 [Pseudomonadota bacterium]